MMKYRADIDGLRAIAIVPVILFHAGISQFAGGYVGVDVFFVISGYLITSIILKDIGDRKFSVAQFYERRIKRIFPALFVVITGTWIVFSVFMLDNSFKALSQSVVATVLFSSNILFLKTSGYFDLSSELKPLLHTWSLGVEEQFYIFYPLLLIFINKYLKSKYLLYLSVATLLSFIANILFINSYSVATFYLLPTRAWELGLGCLIAVWNKPVVRSAVVNNVLAVLGVLLVLFSIFYLDQNSVFPGFNALFPCIGTCLIIVSGMFPDKTFVASILETKPMVMIGKLSYSLYLWHFPVFTFRKYWEHYQDSILLSNFALIVITFLLSIITYRLVEVPARSVKIKSRKVLFISAFSAASVFVAAGLWVHSANGKLPWNRSLDFENNFLLTLPYYDYSEFRYSDDFIIGNKNLKPTVAIWGDSHAASLSLGIGTIADKEGSSVLISTLSGVFPVFDLFRISTLASSPEAKNRQFIDTLKEHPEIKSVILIGRWEFAYTDKLDDGDWRPFYSNQRIISDTVEIRNEFKKNLEETIRELVLLDKKVYVFTDIPTHSVFLNRFFPPECRNVSYHENKIASFVEDMIDIRKRYEFSIVRYHRARAYNGDYCFTIDGKPIYFDDDHLSVFGSNYLAELNRGILKDIFNQRSIAD